MRLNTPPLLGHYACVYKAINVYIFYWINEAKYTLHEYTKHGLFFMNLFSYQGSYND